MSAKSGHKMLSLKKSLKPVSEDQLDSSIGGGGNVWGCCYLQGNPEIWSTVLANGRAFCAFPGCE